MVMPRAEHHLVQSIIQCRTSIASIPSPHSLLTVQLVNFYLHTLQFSWHFQREAFLDHLSLNQMLPAGHSHATLSFNFMAYIPVCNYVIILMFIYLLCGLFHQFINSKGSKSSYIWPPSVLLKNNTLHGIDVQYLFIA